MGIKLAHMTPELWVELLNGVRFGVCWRSKPESWIIGIVGETVLT